MGVFKRFRVQHRAESDLAMYTYIIKDISYFVKSCGYSVRGGFLSKIIVYTA